MLRDGNFLGLGSVAGQKAYDMIEWTLKKIIGTKNDRELKRAWPKVARVNELESKFKALPDEQLPKETEKLKEQVKAPDEAAA